MDYKLLLSGLGAVGTSIVVLNASQGMIVTAPTPTATPTIYEEVVVELPAEEVVEEKVVVTKQTQPKVEKPVDGTSGGSADHEEEEEEEDDEGDED